MFTNLPARWANLLNVDLGNNAMHDVYPWGDRVYAGNDPGHFALDGETLATLGPEDWGGAAKPGMNMSPMPNPDPTTGRLIGWLSIPGKTKPDTLSFVELDQAMRVVKQTPFHPLGAAPVLVHDHRATANYYVAVEQAARLSLPGFLWGKGTLWDALRWPGSATLLVVPREGGGPLVRVPLPGAVIAFHVINAYEDGERLVVDLVTYDAPIQFSAAAPRALRARVGAVIADGPVPTPTRYTVDPRSGALVHQAPLGDRMGEAPEVRDDRMGQPYRYAYLCSPGIAKPEDRGAYFLYGGLSKIDTHTGATTAWSDAPSCTVSPCAFVARPGSTEEDDGWLLAWTVDTEEETGASVVVLDARDIAAGPVARIHLGIHLPGTSHTRWATGRQLQAGSPSLP